MASKKQLHVRFETEQGTKGKFTLEVLAFQEEGMFHLYMPSLDIFGVGDTEAAAEAHLTASVEAYLEDMVDSRNIIMDLRRHGFSVLILSDTQLVATPPDEDKLLEINPTYRDILQLHGSRNIRRKSFPMTLPASLVYA